MPHSFSIQAPGDPRDTYVLFYLFAYLDPTYLQKVPSGLHVI